MIVVIFGAVLLDRPALALRNVALSAFVILVLYPESLFDAGFQMSFAAVSGLVAGYEEVRRRVGRRNERHPGLRVLRCFGGSVFSTGSASVAGAPFAAEQLGLGGALETMRMKLLASLPEDTAREEQRVAARFHLDPVAWFQGPDEQRRLPELALAVWTGRMLHLRYDSWKGVVERTVAPLGLVQKAGLWYLVAAVDGQPRTYRVGSIERLRVESAPAPPVRKFDLRRYWKRFARDYESRMSSMEARIKLRPAALRVLGRTNHALAEVVAAAGAADREGWYALRIPIESVEAAASELLRFGPDVVAVAPPALVARMRRMACETAALYEPKKRSRPAS